MVTRRDIYEGLTPNFLASATRDRLIQPALSFLPPKGRPRRESNPPHTLDKRAASTRCVRGPYEIKCAFAALVQTLFCTEADNRTRTGDLVDGNHVLYQLSYICEGYVTGLEPATAGSTNQCSAIELHTPQSAGMVLTHHLDLIRAASRTSRTPAVYQLNSDAFRTLLVFCCGHHLRTSNNYAV